MPDLSWYLRKAGLIAYRMHTDKSAHRMMLSMCSGDGHASGQVSRCYQSPFGPRSVHS